MYVFEVSEEGGGGREFHILISSFMIMTSCTGVGGFVGNDVGSGVGWFVEATGAGVGFGVGEFDGTEVGGFTGAAVGGGVGANVATAPLSVT